MINNIELYNAFSKEGSPSLRKVLQGINFNDTENIEKILFSNQTIENSFVSGLINNILSPNLTQRIFKNPLSVFYKGISNSGSIENIFIDSNISNSKGEILDKHFDNIVDTVISAIRLKLSMYNQYGLNEFINKQMQVLESKSSIQEFKILISNICSPRSEINQSKKELGLIQNFLDSYTTDQEAIKNITNSDSIPKILINCIESMQLPCNKYNISRVETNTLKKDMVIIIDKETFSNLKTTHNTFILDDFKQTLGVADLIVIDKFETVKRKKPEFENDNNIPSNINGYIDFLPSILICDKNIINMYDYIRKVTHFENVENLTHNVRFIRKSILGISTQHNMIVIGK